MTITIYHNPACGTSRNTLAMIRQSGEEPEIIEYLRTPPDRTTLKDLIRRMGTRPASSCAGRERLMTNSGSTTRNCPVTS